MPLKVGLVAGEKSGDLLGARMVAGLNSAARIDVQGVAGNALTTQGMKAWHSIDELSVRGYIEVVRHLPRLLKLRADLASRFAKWEPAVFVGVDAPDFNIELERRLRLKGVKTVHFIGPSIWAWRFERIKKIKAACDHVLLVFPFEKAIYDKEGIAATYVGHPLADVIPVEVPAFNQSVRTVALLPGSRLDEVKALALPFLETACIVAKTNPDLRFVLPAASLAIEALLDKLFVQRPQLRQTLGSRLEVTRGESHQALARASAVLVASGTATLEVALFKKPMVIAYRMPWISWQLMKDKNYLPYVGLPNILANKFLVPELIQEASTPQAMAQALQFQLDDQQNAAYLAERFTDFHLQLKRDCPARAAEAVLKLVKHG
jgi:lipid-A-disaccharide synthase